MKRILLSQFNTQYLNANSKAKMDIEKILCEEFGFKSIRTDTYNNNTIKKIINGVKKIWISIIYRNADIVFMQLPFSHKKLYTGLYKNKVGLIHDVDGLRKTDEELLKHEVGLYNSLKCLISHNQHMTDFLISQGVDKDKIINLGLFDYICDVKEKTRKFDKENPIVAYIGNYEKAPFLNQLDENKMNYKINFYGLCKIEIKNKKIEHKGAFKPEELLDNIDADLGLVWDGNYDESDEAEGVKYKEYTKYNNPHKLSGYLAAGIPVIVWEKAAVSDFVKENNVGYIINNLYDINKLDFKDIETKKENAKKIGKNLREGYYTKKAVQEVIKRLEK